MMAKLEGVKTLDMVNGEITKVAYGGAEYERVEGKAKVGDMVLVKEAWGGQNVGEFFVVTYTKPGIIDQIVGMDGNTCEASSYKHRLKIFRKVSVSTNPSLEERVSSAEGEIESLKSDVAALRGEAEYKRIDADEAKVGDYVKYIDSDYLDICDYSFTIGKLYEIKAVDEDGDFEHEADNGERLMACPDDEELEFYRKVDAASVEAEPKPERLKVGDYAKVVDLGENRIRFGGSVGDIVKVADVRGIRIRTEELDGGGYNGNPWAETNQLVRATDEEVAEAKDAAEFAKFKEGAKVRLKSGGGEFPLNGFKKGGVYEVEGRSRLDLNLIRIVGGDAPQGYATPDQLEIISEEEFAEAVERKKWSQIGREVGEYKVGDVVAYSDSYWFGNSGIGEVVDCVVEGRPKVWAVDYRGLKASYPIKHANLTLVTPVEARFDC